MPPFQGGDADSNSAGGTKGIGSRGVVWPNTPPCQGGERRFKSGRDRKAFPARDVGWRRGPRSSGEVAQLAEHAAENRGVGSSILPLATSLVHRVSSHGVCPACRHGLIELPRP